ncbi:MAG TPA: hypothetical protein VI669_15925 [Vicinamibacteria bacterium]
MMDDAVPARDAPPNRSSTFLTEIRGGLSWAEWLTPAALAILLSIPCLGLTFLWDDYAFLDNALRHRMWDFLPNASDPFYRPISRGLYFAFLSAVGESGAAVGHLINAVVLAAIAALVAGLGARLGGRRIGICAGVVFAGFACMPTLVAWVCCSQDLFAMLLVALALHARLSGRRDAAFACMAFGVLCKETTLATIPAIVLADWARGRPVKNLWREVGAYALLVAAWITIHPGIRILIARGFQPGDTGYVGLTRALDFFSNAGLYVVELCNLRVGRLLVTWSPAETAFLIGTAIAAAIGMWLLLGRAMHPSKDARSALNTGLVLAAGPLILTSAMILGWGHYYAAFSGLGASLVLGTLIARTSRSVAVACIGVFLLCGLYARSSELEKDYVTENNLRASSEAHIRFRESLFKLEPAISPGTQVLMSVQASGRVRVYHQVFHFQMLGVWYRDPSILVRKPENRRPDQGHDLLMAVTQDLDVLRIDPLGYQVASASGRQPEYLNVEQALRTYAVGLWGSGETDAGARLLVEMPEVDRSFESLHHRMAVAFLLADGREEDARRLLSGIPPASREWALDNLPAVLAQQPSSRQFDGPALRAFGIDSTDASAVRTLTQWFVRRGYYIPAGRFGDRLLTLAPGDPLALKANALRDSVQTVQARQRIRID